METIFFYIDNVDKAGRWGVELYGFQIPKTSQPEQAWYACQNTLRWKLGPTKSNIALALWVTQYGSDWLVRQKESSEGKLGFEVYGVNMGMFGSGCFILFQKDYVVGCGYDDSIDVSFGSRTCSENTPSERYSYISPLSKMNPWTNLSELAETSPSKKFSYAKANCHVNSQDVKTGRKSVFEKIGEKEICYAEVAGSSYNNSMNIAFDWPSGAKTVLEIGYDVLLLNGDASENLYVEGYDTCLKSAKTGNSFCIVWADKGVQD